MPMQISISNAIGGGGGAQGSGGSSFTNTKSIALDGVDDYVGVGTTSLGITSTISVSAWVKIPTTNTGGGGTNIQVIACEDSTASGKRNWIMFWRGTGFNYFAWVIYHTNLSASSVVSTSVVPNDGQWHHLLGTYDGTTNANGLKLYIDGLLNIQGTASSTGINSFTTTEPAIGAVTGGGQWRFEGNIDEVSLFNTELSSTDVTTIYNSGVPNDITSLNPLSWWRCGDGDTAPTLTDNGSGGNNGTMTNFSTFSTDVPVELFSRKSIALDSVDDYVECGNDSSLQITGAMTLSAWVKTTDTNYISIYGKGNSVAQADTHLRMQNTGVIRAFLNNNAINVTGTTAINDGSWHHVMFVYVPSTSMTIYVDGSQEAQNTTSIPSAINNNYSNVSLSRFQPWLGNLDEVAVWNSDQSANVSAIYGTGVPTSLASYSPLSWWRCGDGDTAPTLTDNGSGGNNGTMNNFSTFSTDVPT
jgi:hypothetical protein